MFSAGGMYGDVGTCVGTSTKFAGNLDTVLNHRALDRSAVWDYVLHYMLCILWYGLILLAVKMGPTTSPKNGIAVLKHDDEPKGRRFGRVCL
jgi:hypothetical protein